MSWTRAAQEARRMAANAACAVGAELSPNESLGLTGVSVPNLAGMD